MEAVAFLIVRFRSVAWDFVEFEIFTVARVDESIGIEFSGERRNVERETTLFGSHGEAALMKLSFD